MMVFEIRMRSRAVLPRLERERISKIKNQINQSCVFIDFLYLYEKKPND